MKTTSVWAALSTSLALVGCEPYSCPMTEVDSAADGELTYTEPLSVRDARAERLAEAAARGDTLIEEQTRGPKRVVNEHRSWSSVVVGNADGRTVAILASTVSTPWTFEGITVDMPLSTVSLRFVVPAEPGRHALSDLHASVCERIDRPTGVRQPERDVPACTLCHPTEDVACADVSGTLELRTSSPNVYEGVVQIEGARPRILDARGSVSFRYATQVNEHTCWRETR